MIMGEVAAILPSNAMDIKTNYFIAMNARLYIVTKIVVTEVSPIS